MRFGPAIPERPPSSRRSPTAAARGSSGRSLLTPRRVPPAMVSPCSSPAEEMAAIGALRYAVEAASEAATVFVGQGRSDSARRAAARARELHAPDQGASLPGIDGLDATAVELTPRQAQLGELARRGLSNAEIADRFVISIRTVETHLYRGMQKLGVSDRHDL
jgi:DNA-binding NarL/FixJ family response regulator